MLEPWRDVRTASSAARPFLARWVLTVASGEVVAVSIPLLALAAAAQADPPDASVGVAQSYLLRELIDRAGTWVWASAGAWFVGLARVAGVVVVERGPVRGVAHRDRCRAGSSRRRPWRS